MQTNQKNFLAFCFKIVFVVSFTINGVKLQQEKTERINFND